jgi:hypothetical protein
MELKTNIRDPAGLAQAFERLLFSVVNQYRLALKKSMRNIQETAREDHKFISRTANLERAVDTQVVSEWPPIGEVFLDLTKAPYGLWVHGGSKDHFIRPLRRKALRWVGSDGRFWFSKGHMVSGIKKDEFIYNAAEKDRAYVNAIFDQATTAAIKEAGL